MAAEGGGGAGGRGAHAQTNPRVPGRDSAPAAHREAKPAGWAAEPGSGTGEAGAARARGAAGTASLACGEEGGRLGPPRPLARREAGVGAAAVGSEARPGEAWQRPVPGEGGVVGVINETRRAGTRGILILTGVGGGTARVLPAWLWEENG